MKSWKILFYETVDGQSPVEDFLNSLSVRDREKMIRTIGLLQEYGIQLKMPHSRAIIGVSGLWELRSQVGKTIQRIFYFHYDETVFNLLHGFTKTTQKTPVKEIEIARSRMMDCLHRKELS